MKKENNKKSASALIGAAFLMATSAIGPGFLTQTGKFTDSLHGSFGFVILISVILAAIVQLNVFFLHCISDFVQRKNLISFFLCFSMPYPLWHCAVLRTLPVL